VIVRGLGNRPSATDASMSGMSPAGIEFTARVGDAPVLVEIPWYEQIRTRTDVRAEVVRMFEDACARLGVVPHDSHE
jgi:hypothetical protein